MIILKCDQMYDNKISGNMCMDFCVTQDLILPECSQIGLPPNKNYNVSCIF